MISLAVPREGQRTVPKLSSITRVQQNSQLAARCVVGFTGGCANATPKQWGGNGRCLQIIGSSLFNWNTRRARLAHEAGGRRIFGTARCPRRCRTAGQKRETRDGGDETNGYFRVLKSHKRACSDGWRR